MHAVLIGSAITLFLLGIIILFKPDIWKKISNWLSKPLFSIEANKAGGLLLVVIGIVIYILAMKK